MSPASLPEPCPADETKTKMDVAKEVLSGIVDQLKPEDQLAIVLFRWVPADRRPRPRLPRRPQAAQWPRAPAPRAHTVRARLLTARSDGACVPKPLGPLSCADASDLKAKVGRGQKAARARERTCVHPPAVLAASPVLAGTGSETGAALHRAARTQADIPLPASLASHPRIPLMQIKRDVSATSGTNFQSGIDAGGCPACMAAA